MSFVVVEGFYFLTVFIVNGFFSEFQLALEQLPVMINV